MDLSARWIIHVAFEVFSRCISRMCYSVRVQTTLFLKFSLLSAINSDSVSRAEWEWQWDREKCQDLYYDYKFQRPIIRTVFYL